MPDFAFQLLQPAQLCTDLLDDQAQHPDCFVKTVSNFPPDGPQCGQLTLQFRLEKFLASLYLPIEYFRPCLPCVL